MIKNIIFDFGDVFINLDKKATTRALNSLGLSVFSEKMQEINKKYEIGAISSNQFISYYKSELPKASREQLIEAWNSIILDFPEYRLDFIESLARSKKYRLFLLSNTNALHIIKVKEKMSPSRYLRFKNCFEKFYLSHEIHLRKPNADIFEFVLKSNDLVPQECLFIDDTSQNTQTAQDLGMTVWNNCPDTEDVADLFNLKNELF